MRERPYGGWLWIPNMAVLVVGGVLMRFKGHMGWDSERILGGVGGSYLATLDLRWGDGSKICFWHDVWCRAQTPITSFSDLFSIARFKNALVADHLELSSASHKWNINFLIVAHD
jgi:hypothetical protein